MAKCRVNHINSVVCNKKCKISWHELVTQLFIILYRVRGIEKRWLTLNYIKWHWVTLFFKLFCFKFFLLLSSDNKIYLKICRWCVFRRWDFLFDFILIENVKNITKTMHTNGFSTLISLNCILLELYVYMMRCYIIHTHSGCTCFKMYELIDLDFPS